MSYFGDKLRMFAAMADQATETGPSFNSPVAAGQFARLQSDLMQFQIAVKESFEILERKIKVIDERTDPMGSVTIPELATPKRKRAPRKQKQKEQTQARKRKRRTKAEMLADAQG